MCGVHVLCKHLRVYLTRLVLGGGGGGGGHFYGDTMEACISYPWHTLLTTQTKQADGAYYLLAREGSVEVSIQLEDHDYEEPYFEPASEEEGLLQQLRKMTIPMVDEENELEWVYITW